MLRVIVSEMTYTVSSGTLNSSIPYHSLVIALAVYRWALKPDSYTVVIRTNCQISFTANDLTSPQYECDFKP